MEWFEVIKWVILAFGFVVGLVVGLKAVDTLFRK